MNRSRKIMKKLTAAAAASAWFYLVQARFLLLPIRRQKKQLWISWLQVFPHIGMQLWHSMKRDRKQALTQR